MHVMAFARQVQPVYIRIFFISFLPSCHVGRKWVKNVHLPCVGITASDPGYCPQSFLMDSRWLTEKCGEVQDCLGTL